MTDLTHATHVQHEDPAGDATSSAISYVTLAIAAAQVVVNRAAAARAAKGQDPVELDEARRTYAPMLGKDKGCTATSEVTLAAWTAASPWRDKHKDAEQASVNAEARLRELHPDAMDRYDQLRAGLDPVAAMREVAPLIAERAENPIAAEKAIAPLLGKEAMPEAPQGAQDRYAYVIQQVLPTEVAEKVLADAAWPKLAETLRRAETAGGDAAAVLVDAAQQRPLDDAKSVAQVLVHRMEKTERTAADVAAASFPVPLATAGSGRTTADLGAVVAGLTLAREADHLEQAKPSVPAAYGVAREQGAADVAAASFPTRLAEASIAQVTSASASPSSRPAVVEQAQTTARQR
ncbi:hypothetical protein [Enterococcus hirae]|uniref:hypothetical protein n=1 Tax=Enterococcus hirae TaxID=1354 RepID=UPI00136A05F4|nr:hypothetical protein [Enterococcus hirae]NAE18019.1 hypothetical protein [Enterococcus hirae]